MAIATGSDIRPSAPSGAGQEAAEIFSFASPTERVRALGVEAVLDSFDEARGGVVVGAIPFDARRSPVLIRPRRLHRSEASPPPAATPPERNGARIRAIPETEAFGRSVDGLVEAIQAHEAGGGPLRKVVLARRLRIEADLPFDVEAVARRLMQDRSVGTFVLRIPDGVRAVSGVALVGASPELLVEKRGRTVVSVPLAGSAPRFAEAAADREAADGLLRSAKNRAEHAWVVEYVSDTLAPLCDDLSVDAEPHLSSTESVWHLATRIEGRLRDAELPSLDLARLLHPTPAVCGVPTDEARRLIGALEPFDRGLYAGAVGWADAGGDGRWMVTLRCAELAGATALLHAGAGIVSDSEPSEEVAETSAKFRALLTALGVEEPGGNAPEGAGA